jgi:hypothetical protein
MAGDDDALGLNRGPFNSVTVCGILISFLVGWRRIVLR